MWPPILNASSNLGRTRTRVLIFSLKILSLGTPCLPERVELGVEFLPERRAPCVPNADVRARQVRVDRRRRRGARPPRPARSAVGGSRHRNAFFSRGTIVKRRVW